MTSKKPKRSLLIIVTDPMTLKILVMPQIKALTKADWEVTVICGIGKSDQTLEHRDFKLYQLRSLVREISPLVDLLCIFQILRIVNRIKPDIAIVSTPKASFLGMIACYLARVPKRVYQIRGARWENGIGIGAKLSKATDIVSLKLSTNLVAVSPSLVTLYQKEFNLKKSVSVLGFGSSKGVDTNIFFPPNSFSLDLNSFRIGFIGRLTQDKGVADLIHIFKQLKVQFPNLSLDLIGFADLTDPVSQETIAFIQTSPDIHWFQNLAHHEIAEKVRSWAIMLFPSRREGLPNAVIEAAACGTPTIGWKIGGVVDALPKKHLDFALSPGNLQQATSKVVEVIQRKDYPSIREDFASWAKENFDEKVVAGNFVNYVELQNEESNA